MSYVSIASLCSSAWYDGGAQDRCHIYSAFLVFLLATAWPWLFYIAQEYILFVLQLACKNAWLVICAIIL
jgi:hypothetical protein